LTAAEARTALEQARVARLATAAADGRPHVVPICLAVDGDRIYTAIDHKPKRPGPLQRVTNIAASPRVAVLADHYDDADWSTLWWARADGRARTVGPDDLLHDRGGDLLAERYAQYREQPPAGEMIVIEVERWTGWGVLPVGGS
jgi:PPOX class probable F420-dependent enzyme